MAIDHALLEQVQQDGMPVLRLYSWQPACLSFGRNQRALGFYSAEAALARHIDIVRRPTGGMAVLHAREITYAVVAPSGFLGTPRETYCNINRALVLAMRRLGIPARLHGGGRQGARGTAHPCFAEPAAGEVTVSGAKLVGSAQRCERRTILQHGSILLAGRQDDVAQIACVPFELHGRATTVEATLGTLPPVSEIVNAIRAGFERVCGIPLAPTQHSASLLQRAAKLEALYRSREWTWRL